MTMTMTELYHETQRRHVRLWLDESGALRAGPRHRLSATFTASLREHRERLALLLRVEERLQARGLSLALYVEAFAWEVEAALWYCWLGTFRDELPDDVQEEAEALGRALDELHEWKDIDAICGRISELCQAHEHGAEQPVTP